MINAKKIFLSLFIAQIIPCVAFAGGENNINALLSSWKNPVMSYCNDANMGNSTIGRDKDTCKGNYQIDNSTPAACLLGDDMGVLMLVAREANENGARFCPTTIYAEKKKRGDAWTLYAEPAQGAQPCYWLCKPGYGGESCQSTTPTGCDSAPFRRDDFNTLTMARDPQVESAIAMFHWNQYDHCNASGISSQKQEHDMILAVSDWLPGGHGAWAAPFVIRAEREGKKSQKGGINAWPAAEATLLCKNGYTANAAGNDCVPIDESACALTQMCSNWPSNDFDATTMALEFNDNMGCYTYKCREKGYAFPSNADRTCQPCTENLRGGPSPEDGTCVHCDIGYIYDSESPSTGYCVKAAGYDKAAMQYGTGQSKATPLNNQCWMIAEAEAYSDCVKHGVTTLTPVRATAMSVKSVSNTSQYISNKKVLL